MAALALDLRGHGASGGDLDGGLVDDVAAGLDALAARGHAPLGIRGSSLGGLLALHAGRARPAGARRRGHLPGPARPAGRAPGQDDWPLALDRPSAPARRRRRPRLLARHRRRPRALGIATFALAGRTPRTRCACAIALGGGHGSLQHDPAVLAETAAFLAGHLGWRRRNDRARRGPRGRDRRLPRLPPAGGLARGGGPGEAARVRRPGVLGPAGARLRRPRPVADGGGPGARRPTAPTAPGASSPATAAATSSTRPCTGPASPPSPPPPPPTTACACPGAGSRPPCAAPRPTTGRPPRSADRCLPYLVRELALCPGAEVVLALGAVGWDAVLRALHAAAALAALRPRRRGAGRAGAGCSAATTRARRTSPPAASRRRCSTTCWPAQPRSGRRRRAAADLVS